MKSLIKQLLAATVTFCSLQSIQAGWTPPAIINASSPANSLQYDPFNNLLVSWVDRTLITPQPINVAFLSPLGVLSPPVNISPDCNMLPVESVNPATGDAVVAWLTPSSSNPTSIQAATYSANTQTWAALQTIDTAPIGSFFQTSLATLDPISGKSVVCWLEDDGMSGLIVNAATLNTIPGVWSAPAPLPVSGNAASFKKLGIASNGPYATAMWTYKDGGLNTHYHVELFSGLTNTWTVALDQISTPLFNDPIINLKVDNSGNIAFIAVADQFGNNQILGWATGEPLIEVLSNVDSSGKPSLAVDNAGRAYAIWFTPGSNGDPAGVLHGRTYLFNAIPKQWSPDTPLAAPFVSQPSISPDALGNLYVDILNSASNDQVQITTFTAGATPLVGGVWLPLTQTSQLPDNSTSDQAIAAKC